MTSVNVRHLNQTYIREVNVHYRLTNQQVSTITDPREVARFVRSILPDNSREHFIAMYLDGAHQIISYAVISTGLANVTLIHPREVFQRAVVVGCCALIVAHNHPSGSLTPSGADKEVTDKLTKAGEIIGIKVLDSLIVSRNGVYSITNKNMVEMSDPLMD